MENNFISNNIVVLVILALIVGVVALSFTVLMQQSLRLDEAQSLWQTSHSVKMMLSIIAEDVHVPLYHLMLYGWKLFFGSGVEVGRFLSIIFFVASIPLLYALGNLIYSRKVALFASVLFAVSPFMNWYANEIRMYSLLVFVTLLSHYFFIKIFKEQTTGPWIGYAITALIGIYVHYFFFLTLIVQAIYFLTYRSIFPPKAFRNFLIITFMVVFAISPWLVYVQSLGEATNTQPILPRPTTVDFFNTFSQFTIGFQIDPLNTIFVSFWPLLVLMAFLALRKSTVISTGTLYLLFAFLLPVIILFLLSLVISPAFLSRYLVFTAPAMYLLLSWLFSIYNPFLRNTMRVATVAVMLIGLTLQIVSADSPVKENYREATEYLESRATAQDIIVVSAPFTIYPVEYYYNGNAEISTLPIWDRLQFGPIPDFSEERLPQEIEQLRDSHQKLWLLQSFDQGYQEKMRIYFDTHFQRLSATKFSHDLMLYEYRLRYD